MPLARQEKIWLILLSLDLKSFGVVNLKCINPAKVRDFYCGMHNILAAKELLVFELLGCSRSLNVSGCVVGFFANSQALSLSAV